MKFLIIGLGSMGKRRIRCLKYLGYRDITGFDIKDERQNDAVNLYNIKIISNYSRDLLSNFDAVINSTPPDVHKSYILDCIRYNIPTFVEASVILEDVEEVYKTNNDKIFIAPSNTLRFNSVIKEIKSIVTGKIFGEVTNFSYHSGQYLPDWHPWESIRDFYVSKKETGGAREIVPFELSWIIDVFGIPEEIKGYFLKTMDLGIDIEDTYAFNLKYNKYLASVIVDVTSRFATRNLIINLEEAQITWNWNDDYFEVYNAKSGKSIKYYQQKKSAETGYNKNISESMYIEEISTFIKAMENPNIFPNSLKEDILVLKLLNKLENGDGGLNK